MPYAPRLIGRLQRLPILAEAAASLIAARAALAFAPIDHLLSGDRHPGATSPITVTPSDPRAVAVASALAGAARRLPGASTCLARALAGRWMLERRELEAIVHLGVRSDGAPLAAHAWLEAGGGVVSGRESMAQFAPIAQIRSARRKAP